MFTVQKSEIDTLSRALGERQEHLNALQEDLDMLLLEKVERQEEDARLMEEWKSKQNRVDLTIASDP